MEVPLGTILIDPQAGVTGIVRVQRSTLTKLGKVKHTVGVCTADFHGGMRVKAWYPAERVQVVGAHGVVMPKPKDIKFRLTLDTSSITDSLGVAGVERTVEYFDKAAA